MKRSFILLLLVFSAGCSHDPLDRKAPAFQTVTVKFRFQQNQIVRDHIAAINDSERAQRTARPDRLDWVKLGDKGNGMTIENGDIIRETAMSVAVVHAGKKYYQNQHVFFRSDEHAPYEEIKPLSQMGVEHPRFVVRAEGPMLIFSSRLGKVWQPGSPERLYCFDPRSRQIQYFAHGACLYVSPDRRYGLFSRNRDSERAELNTFFLYDASSAAMTPILSIWHVDPYSGSSWSLGWSKSSDAIYFHGTCCGFSPDEKGAFEKFFILYSISEGAWYDITKDVGTTLKSGKSAGWPGTHEERQHGVHDSLGQQRVSTP